MSRRTRPAGWPIAALAWIASFSGAATADHGDAARRATAPYLRLAVPVIAQAPERCGPAALAMVLRFYGADAAAEREADRAYSPALRGALITDLARCAERAGYAARVATPGEDSLLALLVAGIPPLLHYRRGLGPLSRGHFGVLIGWDGTRAEYLVNDGGARTARYRRADLLERWRAAGALALIVTPRAP